MSRTAHQARVTEFMLRAKQSVPQVPTIPDERTRILRAKLIIEEAFETVEALGVSIGYENDPGGSMSSDHPVDVSGRVKDFKFAIQGKADLEGIVDGCADISVVTIGTLCACGVQDNEVLEAVDHNNLDKFKPGHSFREDGKLIKSPTHKKVDLLSVINAQ